MKKILITLMLVLGTTFAQAQDFEWWIAKTHKNAWTVKISGYDEKCKAAKIFLWRDGRIVDQMNISIGFGFGQYHTDPHRLEGITGVSIKCIKQ